MELFLDRKVMGNLQNMAEVDVSCPGLQVECYSVHTDSHGLFFCFFSDPIGCEGVCLVLLLRPDWTSEAANTGTSQRSRTSAGVGVWGWVGVLYGCMWVCQDVC